MQHMQLQQEQQQQQAENNINNNQKTTRKYQLTNNYTDHLERARGIAIGVVFLVKRGLNGKGYGSSVMVYKHNTI